MNLDIETTRRQMIGQQVRSWDVLDARVLQTLNDVPREQFVPAPYRTLAFADINIPFGHGQSMLTPKTEGRLLQALAVQPTDSVLVIGVGSGYMAACLAQLGKQVRAIEIYPDIAVQARNNLQANAVNNVVVEDGDGMQLNLNQGYDAILITGSLPVYDQRFQRALKIAGRLVLVTGIAPAMQAIRVTRSSDTHWQREGLFETELPPLLNTLRPAAFVF